MGPAKRAPARVSNLDCSRSWLGFDPGGKNAFGVAVLNEVNAVVTRTVSSVIEAIAFARSHLNGKVPEGAGIDAPLWWSARRGGGRLVDANLREKYKIRSGTIQSPNSLRGSALVQGALLVEHLRTHYPNITISEAHPKALLRGPYGLKQTLLHGVVLSSDNPSDDDHERDAVLAALAVREGQRENWNADISLNRYPEEQDPKAYWMAPVHYYWPEDV